MDSLNVQQDQIFVQFPKATTGNDHPNTCLIIQSGHVCINLLGQTHKQIEKLKGLTTKLEKWDWMSWYYWYSNFCANLGLHGYWSLPIEKW